MMTGRILIPVKNPVGSIGGGGLLTLGGRLCIMVRHSSSARMTHPWTFHIVGERFSPRAGFFLP
jgi:hypothetical protein